MAYDEELAGRVRDLFAGEPDLVERKMFGGLAFLVGGHLTVAVSGSGGLMVRVDRASYARLAALGPAVPVEMRGRAMTGWLLVPEAAVASPRSLRTWVERSTAFVATLPPKAARG